MNFQIKTVPTSIHKGFFEMEHKVLPCALGRSGMKAVKREGDGATPIGKWKFDYVMYRADRVARPQTSLPVFQINRNDGWCDAVGDRNYNRPVPYPYPASAENLWRKDDVYNIIVVLDHNQRPRIQGGGSAIFMHLIRAGYKPTAGCIAFTEEHLRLVLRFATLKSRIIVG